MSNLVMPFMASTLAQQFVRSMLSDDVFIDHFIQQSKTRLLASYQKLKIGLEGLGIPVIPADGAIFCVVDLGFLFGNVDGEGTWQDEHELHQATRRPGKQTG